MKNKPLLSICIPSYNREKYLKECLDSIINQEGFNEEEIEIVISDNASTDNTTELVKKYQEKYKTIIYHRNKENIGPLKNILSLPHYANGDYVRFLSDDDMLSHIAIGNTIQTIKKDRPGLILSKMFGFRDGEKVDIKKIDIKGNITTVTGMNGFFDFLSKIRYDITPYMMLLSLFCCRKDVYEHNLNKLLQERGKEYKHIIEKDNFPHSRVIFVPFGNQEKISVIERDLVLCRGGNISRSPSWTVCQDLSRLIKDLNKSYKINKITYGKLKRMYYFSIFSFIVITHLRRYIPKCIYNFLVRIGRHTIKGIRNLRNKIR